MKIKKQFRHSKGRSIWRILLNNESLLLVEERDLKTREVFFQVFDLATGRKVIADLQLREKFWVGVESFNGDTIYFHGYKKPDMPWHQGISAYSVRKNALLWEHPEYVFSFMDAGTIVGIQQQFESSKYYAISAETGHLTEELTFDAETLKSRREEVLARVDYSKYVFPVQSALAPEREETLRQHMKTGQLAVESLFLNDVLLVTLQDGPAGGPYNQCLKAIDIPSKKVIFNQPLNENQKTVLFDSFFIYDKHLVVIKNKEEVLVFSLVM